MFAPMKSLLLPLACIAVLGITLSLGLWPFHAPKNDISWLENRNGLHLGRASTIFSSHLLPTGASPEATLEIWVLPRRMWDSATLLSLYHPETRSVISLRQSEAGLLLEKETRRDRSPSDKSRFFVADLLRSKDPRFLTVTSGSTGTKIYLNGTLVATSPDFQLSANDFSGRLILGDSPWQTSSWTGELLGFALYHGRHTDAEVLQNYTSWKQNGRPATEKPNIAALYLFDEHSGAIIHDQSPSHADLYIPPTYQVIDQIFLEPVWNEFGMTRSYWGAALKNIVGFIPFGFCFYAYLVTRLSPRRAFILTVGLGTTISLTIEVLQVYLPTRDSGTTDLITNTLGTWIGVVSYRLLARWLLSSITMMEDRLRTLVGL